jgi:hypothetical protein
VPEGTAAAAAYGETVEEGDLGSGRSATASVWLSADGGGEGFGISGRLLALRDALMATPGPLVEVLPEATPGRVHTNEAPRTRGVSRIQRVRPALSRPPDDAMVARLRLSMPEHGRKTDARSPDQCT